MSKSKANQEKIPHPPHSISFEGVEDLTRQADVGFCDVTAIVEKFTRTGLIDNLHRAEPQYGDAPDQTFYEAACINAELNSLEEEGGIPDLEEKTPSEASQKLSEDTEDDSLPGSDGLEDPPVPNEGTES